MLRQALQNQLELGVALEAMAWVLTLVAQASLNAMAKPSGLSNTRWVGKRSGSGSGTTAPSLLSRLRSGKLVVCAVQQKPHGAQPAGSDQRRDGSSGGETPQFRDHLHPDAGKTTLTEKLLLYGGAIQQAGAVKAKGEQRKVTSDWMELEKQRGISITSTVLQFDYSGSTVNLLDTPGHQDFSEDTYRTLAAADNAVMLEDAAKGLEPQTRKLFEVCRMRRIPIFTFINKMDRPGRDPRATR